MGFALSGDPQKNSPADAGSAEEFSGSGKVMYPPPGRYTNLLRGRPKLTAMAKSTFSITASST